MTTRSDLISRISSQLHSYTGTHEVVTHLTATMGSGVFTASVNSTDGAKRGIAEIEDELVYVDSVSGTSLVIPPFGRGYRGTTAASHASGEMVTFDPAFPRVEIGNAIDQIVAGLYPALYQVKETTLAALSIDRSYTLPVGVEEVLRVETKWSTDPTDYWYPINNWELEKKPGAGAQHTLNLYEGAPTGWDVKVVYSSRFGTLTTDTATAGIPDSYEDLITYGATSKLIRFLEPARLQLGSVENVSRANLIQSGDAGKTATQLYALYQQRVAEERRQLLEQFPPRSNFLAR